jgi:hypothetical protein
MKTKHTEKQALKHAIPRAKLGLIIFLLTMMVASVNAQSQRMSIAVTDTTLETVIKSIRKQTDVNIIYNNEEVNKYKKVTVNVQNGTVEDVLKQALAKTRLTYVTENRTFIIKKIKSEETIQPPKNLPTQTVRGTIIDRESKIPLPGASVVVVDSDPLIGTATDFNGNFTITNVPIGRHDFKVSFVGYQDAVLTQILVGTATEVVLTIEISESITALDEITVTNVKGEPINEMSTISAKSFSVEETKRYAASIGDPARMAQSFAGVSTGDDASNEIIIRG